MGHDPHSGSKTLARTSYVRTVTAGGAERQVSTLASALAAIHAGEAAEGGAEDPAIDQVLKQIGALGLTRTTPAGAELTELGRAWSANPAEDDLVHIMHSKIAYFGEVLAIIADAPRTVEDLRECASRQYLLNWRSRDQVRRRLMWLQALGLVEAWPDHTYRITSRGVETLPTLSIVDPSEIKSILVDVESSAEIEPAPGLLQDALDQATSETRSIALPYLTRDPTQLLTVVTKATVAARTKSELVDLVANHFSVSSSSSKMAVDAAGALGLYSYSGKRDVTATALGREWLSNASQLNLVRLLHARFQAICEALLHLDEEPRAAGEIHRRLFETHKTPVSQNRTASVLRYLAAAGAVQGIGHARYVITGRGRSLREELSLRHPSALSPDSEPADANAWSREFETEALAEELEVASRDSSHPDRFEHACSMAFRALGVTSEHIGGPGRTDVLITIRSNLDILSRTIMDAKSAAGQLNETSVKFDALKEHALKHRASQIVVVAPSFEGSGRLVDWAHSNGVVLYTAAEIGDLLRSHDEYPFSASEVSELLQLDGKQKVSSRREAALARVALVQKVIEELLAESAQAESEPISARDIRRTMRRKDTTVADSDLDSVLSFLAQPDVSAVEADSSGGFTMPSAPIVAARRLRSLANALERAASSMEAD